MTQPMVYLLAGVVTTIVVDAVMFFAGIQYRKKIGDDDGCAGTLREHHTLAGHREL